MCERDHKPEPGMELGGIPIVICDDVPIGGGVMLPGGLLSADKPWSGPISTDQD